MIWNPRHKVEIFQFQSKSKSSQFATGVLNGWQAVSGRMLVTGRGEEGGSQSKGREGGSQKRTGKDLGGDSKARPGNQQQMDSKVNKGGGSQAAEAGVGSSPAVGGPGGAGDQLQEIVNRWAS